MNTNDNYQQREWDNTNQQSLPIQSTQYNNTPQSRQDHILQQLSAIKEVCISCFVFF